MCLLAICMSLMYSSVILLVGGILLVVVFYNTMMSKDVK